MVRRNLRASAGFRTLDMPMVRLTTLFAVLLALVVAPGAHAASLAATQKSLAREMARAGSYSGAYVVTDHVDDLYLRLTTAGVKVIREIEDQPYGSREFAIADPEGNKWSFGTYRGEPRPDQG